MAVLIASGFLAAVATGMWMAFDPSVRQDDDVITAVAAVCALVAFLAYVGRRLRLDVVDVRATAGPRLEAALEGLRLVEDEMPRGKAATGWIDVTGAEQPTKKFAAGTTPSGWEVDVFRDEWFHASGQLRDGAHLRVAAVERRRVKRDRWKAGSSGKRKLKRGSTATAHMLEMKLRTKGGGTATVTVPCSDPFTPHEVAAGLAALHQARQAPPAAPEGAA
jgi:hypothetical protein